MKIEMRVGCSENGLFGNDLIIEGDMEGYADIIICGNEKIVKMIIEHIEKLKKS